jgi:hypothetical protein
LWDYFFVPHKKRWLRKEDCEEIERERPKDCPSQAVDFMASTTNVVDLHVDVDQLLVRCGYTVSTAKYVRKTSALWKGSRVVSLTEAIEKLEALVEAKPRKRLLRHMIPKVLGELKEELKGASLEPQTPDGSGTLAQALASLAGLAGLNRGASLRMSPENLPSLIDTVALLTGKSGNRSAECAKNVINKYFNDDTKITYNTEKIGASGSCGRGRRRRLTPFPKTLEVLVEFVLLLPGRKAAALRQNAASLIVRYYGGDEKMIDEILEHRRVQVRMGEEEPENPMRVFGQTVDGDGEESAAPSDPSEPSDANGSAGSTSTSDPPPFRRTTVITKFRGTTDEDLYAMELTPKTDQHHHHHSAGERRLYKIGKSKEVEVRRHDLALDFSQGFWVSTLLILKRGGYLEQIFHRRLQEYRCDVPRHRNGKELSKSREVFDLQKWAGESDVVTQLLELTEDIVTCLDSRRRTLSSQDEAEPKRRRYMDDLELERERTLQVLAEADARKADAEARKADAEARKADAEARKAEAEADARKAEADARKVEADARKAEADAGARKAEADARRAEAHTRNLELMVTLGAEVQLALAHQWQQA